MIAFLLRNGNNGTEQEEEEGRHYGTHFESHQQVSIERDNQAAHEEEIKSYKDDKVAQVAIFLTMFRKLPLITFFNILNLFINRPNAISILIRTCDK